ncbi:MAG: hypothetical protein KAX44_05930, partial [Candidatus Brocadiae bacterium]|nr:hypothetical protein [Candidatus Brocadiia bacterium]
GLVGLIHGGESGPELIIPALERLVAESPDLLTAARIVAIPAVNIDARQQMVAGTPWYLRTTPAGVDLNRNFPARWHEVGYGYGLDSSDPDSATYRGPCAGAAPETRAVMSVFSERRPDVLFSFHWLASICELPALAPTCEDRRHRPYCRSVIESYARGLYPELPFSENWLAFDGTPGALPTWLYDLGCLAAFDLEGGVRAEARPCQTDQTDRSLLEEYQQRHYDAIRSLLGEWAA